MLFTTPVSHIFLCPSEHYPKTMIASSNGNAWARSWTTPISIPNIVFMNCFQSYPIIWLRLSDHYLQYPLWNFSLTLHFNNSFSQLGAVWVSAVRPRIINNTLFAASELGFRWNRTTIRRHRLTNPVSAFPAYVPISATEYQCIVFPIQPAAFRMSATDRPEHDVFTGILSIPKPPGASDAPFISAC